MSGEQAPGLIRRRSDHDAPETADRFRAAAKAAGLTLFGEIDHAAGAAEAGLSLGSTLLLVFGNARGGTPLMQLDPTVGIDLPLKALIWTDEQGVTWFGWNDPRWVADRHGLGAKADPVVAALSAGLEKLAAAATT